MKGKIIRWNDKRGFGFINCVGTKDDIFAHISKFRKGYRRPKNGDLVEFEIKTEAGKKSAHSIIIQGLEPLSQNLNPFSIILGGFIVAMLAFSVYMFFIKPILHPAYEEMGFSCQGKTLCSEMISCNEAKFYLAHCSGIKIDGDHDGIPCESQWCGR